MKPEQALEALKTLMYDNLEVFVAMWPDDIKGRILDILVKEQVATLTTGEVEDLIDGDIAFEA